MTRTQAYRQIGLMIAGTGVSYGTSPALCEDKKGILDAILPKNKNGEVEWGKVTSQVTDGAYWDDIMKAVGDKVRLPQLRRKLLSSSFPMVKVTAPAKTVILEYFSLRNV